MPRKGYSTIALPIILLDKVEEIVKNKKYTYISRPEFIKEAIRDKLKDMN